MITFQAGGAAAIALLAVLAGACSREQQDWRSAEAADTTEAYGRFLEQHPGSELAREASGRVAQLTEQRDWRHAGSVNTLEGYREYLVQHPTGRWSEEARIRIEGFALGSAPRLAAQPARTAVGSTGTTGVRVLQLAAEVAAVRERAGQDGVARSAEAGAAGAAGAAPPGRQPPEHAGLAQPGEPAEPADAAPQAAERPSDAAPPLRPAHALRVSEPGTADASDGYGVQLGAFGSAAGADREWQRLQARFNAQLGGLEPRIVVASTASGELYRLQARAAGEVQARALCDSLRQQAQACLPVLPR